MTFSREDLVVEALVTDRYLDALLAAGDEGPVEAAAFGWADGGLDRGVRLASLRLRRDLPRFHPSFRFEERLALRLAEAAGALRVARAAGAEGDVVALGPGPADVRRRRGFERRGRLGDLGALDDIADLDELVPGSPPRGPRRPLLIRSAFASAAISLAGAAYVAWRRSRPAGSPMTRAVRAAHEARSTARIQRPVSGKAR